ncbi:hypothetical protein [Pseudotamlana agarivorans]|uniref:hypothetical protein n=1 Tax=Pseudotamlana agarivorans TaxID=481183 RepID=UPI000834044F|nr:hypothetical protein [Tamlana agarivorans]
MANNKIKINKDIDLLELDKLYVELATLKKRKEILIDLIIPYEMKNDYLGLTPNIIQFVSTWLRSENSGKLIIDVKKDYSKFLESISRNDYLFPLIGLVWNNNGVYDLDGNSLRKQLRTELNKVFIKMAKVEALKGDKLLLTNLDHLPGDMGGLPCFESNGSYISNERDLAISLEKVMIDDVLRNYGNDIHTIYKEVKKDLNSIVYELMKNTFEWAKTDEEGVPFDPNIRGVLIKMNKRVRTKLLDHYSSSKAISNFFENKRLKENDKGEVYFLEISVFDSGSGFIKKFKSLNKGNEDLTELEIIKKCLIKHNTSAKGLNKSDKGIGLDRILQILNGKGWLRIKTGKSCVYRNLITEPYINIETDKIEEMKLFDWSKNSDVKFSDYQNVSGSVITIIYPLSINR